MIKVFSQSTHHAMSVMMFSVPWSPLVTQMIKNPPAMWETWVPALGWEDPWRRDWLPLQYSCLENSMDRGPWWAIVHGVTKNQTPLNDFHFTLHLNNKDLGYF